MFQNKTPDTLSIYNDSIKSTDLLISKKEMDEFEM